MKRRFSVLLIMVTAAFASSQKPASNSLVRVGGISAENGEFAMQDALITAYTDQTIGVEFGPNPKRQFLGHSGSASFEVKGESMQRVQNHIPVTLAHEFQLCDSFNQIDRSNVDTTIVSALPKNAKVKSTEDLIDGRILVVYTVPDNSNDSLIGYKIMVSLLKADPAQGYSVVGSDTVTSYGFYCGIQALTKNLRTILVNEPAGSSDFSAVYIYALKPAVSPSAKPK
jgi:hypothetical protein